jgi:hypothetical protein
LDFLGFVRPNRDFSRGYEQKNKKNRLASQVVCKTSQRAFGSPFLATGDPGGVDFDSVNINSIARISDLRNMLQCFLIPVSPADSVDTAAAPSPVGRGAAVRADMSPWAASLIRPHSPSARTGVLPDALCGPPSPRGRRTYGAGADPLTASPLHSHRSCPDASWSGPPRPAEYKVAVRSPRPTASSPPIRISSPSGVGQLGPDKALEAGAR